MTEDEAKTKWCHVTRATGNGPANGSPITPVWARCLGSSCMAWQDRYTRPVVKGVYSETPHGASIATAHTYPEIVSDGYCGLAGKPE